jgi:two-component system, cell cycle response regulator
VSNKPLKHVLEETIIHTEKTEKSVSGTPQQVAEPFFHQLSGRETGRSFSLKGRTVKIGRDTLCEISVDDPHVSRVHAVIAEVNGAMVIRDLESTNGVFVNGNKVKEQRLSDGDKVLVGTRLYFRFSYQDALDKNYQQALFRAANMDALTQLYNKKYFLDILPKEMSFSKRSKEPLSLMMIDVDFFKKVNDTFGHLAGDAVLKSVGQQLQKQVRLENVACRYGGEEMAVILRNCSAELAFTVAERIRTSIEKETIVFRDQKIQITVSAGIATYVNDCFASMEDFVQKADQYLYEAKHSGRNRVITDTHRSE